MSDLWATKTVFLSKNIKNKLLSTAYLKAYSAIFNEAYLVIIFKFSPTLNINIVYPYVTKCSKPLYSPSVFSLIVTTSTF